MSVQKKITWVFANSMKRNEEQTADHRNPMCFVPCVFIFLLEATLDETIFPFATGFAFISSFFSLLLHLIENPCKFGVRRENNSRPEFGLVPLQGEQGHYTECCPHR